MRLHKAAVHGGECSYKCPECRLGKMSPGALSNHMKTAHNQGKKEKKTVTCEICGKVMNHDYFKTHMKIHLEVKEKVCHFCGKAFVSKGALRMHLRVHTGENPFVCHVCGKGFNQRTPHRRHLEVHKKHGTWVEKKDG